MTKIGVGVGEDFAVNENSGGEERNGRRGGRCGYDPRYDDPYYQDWRWSREEWRRQKYEWRRARREWKRRWKYEMHNRMRDRYGDDPPHGFFWFGLPFVLIPLAGIALIVAFFTALFRFPFILLLLLGTALFYAIHRRHHRHWDYHPAHDGPYDGPRGSYGRYPRDSEMEDVTPRPSQTRPQTNTQAPAQNSAEPQQNPQTPPPSGGQQE